MNSNDVREWMIIADNDYDWKAGVHTPSFRTVQVIHFAHDI